MIYGYARVSTKGQKKDGNSLSAQKEMLLREGCEKIFEEAFTGTTTDRPELNKLKKIVKEGDIIIFTKLDRVARSTKEGLELIQYFMEKGCEINILNMGHISNNGTGKLMYTMFLAFAEFERDMIVNRTIEGKAVAKTKPGYTEGRPKSYSLYTRDAILEDRASGKYTMKEIASRHNIGIRTLYRILEEDRMLQAKLEGEKKRKTM